MESGCLRQQVLELERECGVLQQSLAQLELRLQSSEEDRENFAKLAQQRDKELQELHATVESSGWGNGRGLGREGFWFVFFLRD